MSAVWPFASKVSERLTIAETCFPLKNQYLQHIESEIFGAVERSISGSFNLRNDGLT